MDDQEFSDSKLKLQLESLSVESFAAESRNFSDWLAGIEFRLENNILHVSFIHQFFQGWFITHYQKWFETIITSRILPGCRITYTLNTTNFSRHDCASIQNGPNFNQDEFLSGNKEHPDFFNDYIVTDKNRLAVEAARQACDNRVGVNSAHDSGFFQILGICGASGTGKTRLVQCICQTIVFNGSAQSVLRLQGVDSCIELQNTGFFSSHSVAMPSLLVIDDFHEFIERPDCQKAIVKFLQRSGQTGHSVSGSNGRQLIFTFCGSQPELCQLIPRLKSRIESGLVVELPRADLDLRLKYLERETSKNGLKLSREIIFFICRHCQSVPQLEGILQKIKFFVELRAAYPSIKDLEIMLSLTPGSKTPGWQKIIECVGRKLAIKPTDLLGSERRRNYVLARHIGMFLCRKKLGLSYPELGRLFGGRDHSTIMHGIKNIRKLVLNDKDTHKLITELEEELGQKGFD